MPAEQLHISHETPELHSQVVQETVLGWSKMEPDLVLLAMETGGQVHTTRMFLSIFSPSVRDLCSTVSVFTSPLIISVPASLYALENLLAVLTTGSVLTCSKDNLMEVTGAAACLGIQLRDIQIGVKREKEQLVKKIPSKRGRKKKSENEKKTKKPRTPEEKSKNPKPKQTVDHDQDNSLELNDDQKFSKTELDEIMNNSDNIEKEDSSERSEENIETSDANDLGNSQEAESSSDEFDENKSSCSDELDENKSNSSEELDENKSKCSDELDENKSIKPKNKECNDCGKTFSNTTGLKQHRTVHTGEKPFKCDQCDKSFGQKGSLLNHKVIHSGEKPFKCSECDKAFTQKGNMKSHMMKGHPTTEEVPS